MKKISFVLVLLFATITATQAQHVFNKGDMMFNAGIGIPNSYGFIPTLNFSGEYGAIPTGDIGIVSFGALAEFHLAHYSDYWYYGDSYSETWPRFYIGARAAWHLQVFESDEWDVYGGVGFGLIINGKTKHGYYDPATVTASPDIFIGGRWMFKENMGLFAELGYTGLSTVKAGITFGL